MLGSFLSFEIVSFFSPRWPGTHGNHLASTCQSLVFQARAILPFVFISEYTNLQPVFFFFFFSKFAIFLYHLLNTLSFHILFLSFWDQDLMAHGVKHHFVLSIPVALSPSLFQGRWFLQVLLSFRLGSLKFQALFRFWNSHLLLFCGVSVLVHSLQSCFSLQP